jgi:hypothetical protein
MKPPDKFQWHEGDIDWIVPPTQPPVQGPPAKPVSPMRARLKGVAKKMQQKGGGNDNRNQGSS